MRYRWLVSIKIAFVERTYDSSVIVIIWALVVIVR